MDEWYLGECFLWYPKTLFKKPERKKSAPRPRAKIGKILPAVKKATAFLRPGSNSRTKSQFLKSPSFESRESRGP